MDEAKKDGLLEQWKKLADKDFSAAKQLATSNNLLLSVFHLQQYYHNLSLLAREADLILELGPTFSDILDNLNPYYIKARYPTYTKQLEEELDKDEVDKLIKMTEDFVLWLNQKMK
ncbi:MAG: HEPN domain-containing protein [Oligoflexia bacterium]|nr:HEPN domain-containing protein [Oligoflexia bacterium]